MVLLDRLPLPNLKAYSFVSLVALSVCVYFSSQTIKDPNWNNMPEVNNKGALIHSDTNSTEPDSRSITQFMFDVFTVMIREPICVWVSIVDFYLKVCINT